MKPLGIKPDGHAYDEASPTRTREKHAIQRHERATEVGQELDEEPFCELCGGPCTGDSTSDDPLCCIHGNYHRSHCDECEAFEKERFK